MVDDQQSESRARVLAVRAGYYDGHMAVAHRNGEWVLRAAIPQDQHVAESQDAQAAMAHWRERNKAKFSRLKDER